MCPPSLGLNCVDFYIHLCCITQYKKKPLNVRKNDPCDMFTLQFAQCVHATQANQGNFPEQQQHLLHWKMWRSTTAKSCNHIQQLNRQ